MKMGYCTCLLALFSTFSLFLNAWGLSSESIMGDDKNIVDPNDYGYFVLIHTKWSNANDFFKCSGAIINLKYAVTSSRCMKTVRWANRIFVGPVDYPVSELKADTTNNYKVEKAYSYPKTDVHGHSDLGVVKLRGKFKQPFYPHVKILKLPPVGFNDNKIRKADVLGIGFNEPGRHPPLNNPTVLIGKSDEKLRLSTYELITNENLPGKSYKKILSGITESNIEPFGLVTPLDIGGPLVYEDKILLGTLLAINEYTPKDRTIAYFSRMSYYQGSLTRLVHGLVEPHIETKLYD